MVKKIKSSFNGIEYVVRYTHMRKNRGSCDHPKKKEPEILIDTKLTGNEELEVTIPIIHIKNDLYLVGSEKLTIKLLND